MMGVQTEQGSLLDLDIHFFAMHLPHVPNMQEEEDLHLEA